MNTPILVGQLAIAVAGCAWLAWEALLARRGRSAMHRGLRLRGLELLAVLGLAAFVNFGTLRDGRLIHTWDTYHYYIGAKYFPELRYERIYDCTAVADAESGLRREVALRSRTDLRTNLAINSFEILTHPEVCTKWFTAARWHAFLHDVAWFRARAEKATWRRIQRDHGYNATPVWNLVGHAVTNTGPASDVQITCLVLVDFVLLAGAMALLGMCFGPRVLAVAAVMLGTFYPSQFNWIGGAFLRFDWVFCMVAGVCALKQRRPFLGGIALASAALLRLFPAAMLIGPLIVAVDHAWRTRRIGAAYTRLFAGAIVCIAIALPPSLAFTGDWGKGFVENTRKHADTPLANNMGLATALSYRPEETARELSRTTDDVWPVFKAARRAATRIAWPAIVLVGVAVLALLLRAARQDHGAEPDDDEHRTLWRAAVLSLLVVPVVLQLTCYYFIFVFVFATLAERRPGVGAILLAMCAGSLMPGILFDKSMWMDERFVLLSGVMIAGLTAVFLSVIRRRSPLGRLTDARV